MTDSGPTTPETQSQVTGPETTTEARAISYPQYTPRPGITEAEIREVEERIRSIPSQSYKLRLVQQPEVGKCLSQNANRRGQRWPIEPPPIVELTSQEQNPNNWIYLHNPNWFCWAELIPVETKRGSTSKDNKEKKEKKEKKETKETNLTGASCSSLHKVRHPEDTREHGYFVFGDLNVRDAGRYKLRFSLFEQRRFHEKVYAVKVDAIESEEFEVVPAKQNVPASESSALSKAVADAGVKLRLRKETSKRRVTTQDWSSNAMANFQYRNLNPIVPQPPNMHLPPAGVQQTRLSRNLGEDLSGRTQMVRGPVSSPIGGNPVGGNPVVPQFLGTMPPMTEGSSQHHSQSSPYRQPERRRIKTDHDYAPDRHGYIMQHDNSPSTNAPQGHPQMESGLFEQNPAFAPYPLPMQQINSQYGVQMQQSNPQYGVQAQDVLSYGHSQIPHPATLAGHFLDHSQVPGVEIGQEHQQNMNHATPGYVFDPRNAPPQAYAQQYPATSTAQDRNDSDHASQNASHNPSFSATDEEDGENRYFAPVGRLRHNRQSER